MMACTRHPFRFRLDPLDLHPKMLTQPLGGQQAAQRPGQARVKFGQRPLAALEDGHLAAETLEHLADLQGDHPAADDQQ